jgi:hypothetical protein
VRVPRVFITGLVLAGVALAGASPAAAQGKGKGLGKGRGPTPPAPSSASASAPSAASAAAPIFGIRQFGAWLDDASLLETGSASAAVSLGLVRSAGGRQTDFPIVDAGLGLTPRVQLAMTVPYYQLSFVDGSQAAGLGDVYLAAKVGLIDPAKKTTSGFGLAVSPLLEILADPDPTSSRQLHVGLPVSVEWRQPKYRVYGSSGWFSRGAFFASGALELPLTDRVVVTGVLSHTRA